jgi:arginyl-tRNA synthetase
VSERRAYPQATIFLISLPIGSYNRHGKNMRTRLRNAVQAALIRRCELKPEELPAFTVEVPHLDSHGDFATNAALAVAHLIKKPPRQIALWLCEELSNLDFVERVEVAGPGFVNVFIRPGAWRAMVVEIVAAAADFGRSRAEQPESVMVEFVSANPTGPLHVGHGRGAVIGDVLANLIAVTGHRVYREFYVNDAGNQVHNLALSVLYHLRAKRGLTSTFPEDGYRGVYVMDLADQVPAQLTAFVPNEPSSADLDAIQEFAVSRMLAVIKDDLASFGVRMDRYSSERDLVQRGRLQETFDELEKREAIQTSDGARWFLAEKYGDEKPRVLVKSDGSNTYFATDVAYHLDKLRRGFDRLINIWGADHHGYIPRLKAALAALGHPPEKLEVLLVQMVSLLRDGQPVLLSKRAGEIISMREVVEEVGPDAARFFFLMRSSDSQMEFDLELAKKRSLDNPVFYVQYGHARLSSILAKAAERGIPVPQIDDVRTIDVSPLTAADELLMIKKMADFPDMLRRAAENCAPHLVVFYVQDLVATFHRYYTTGSRTNPILGGDPKQIAARLVFVLALRQVIRNALTVLGVSAPDRMESLPAADEQQEPE